MNPITTPRNPLVRYSRWLHTRWPAGEVEALPRVNEDGTCSVPGVRIVGDLGGIPLLKFSLQTGADAVRAMVREPGFARGNEVEGGVYDLVILGGGAAGFSAALEAKKEGLRFTLVEASEPFSTIVNFPRRKPIYVYPSEMEPQSALRVSAPFKEELLEELLGQVEAANVPMTMGRAERLSRADGLVLVHLEGGEVLRAQRVIVAIGRSGSHRRLNVPGEELDKVTNRLHDPADFSGKRCLVVGGGDSALETAVALAQAGAEVALSYRRGEFSRPKEENREALEHLTEAGRLTLLLSSEVRRITPDAVVLAHGGQERTLPNDFVFTMLGREAPLEFLRRSGIAVAKEHPRRSIALFALFLLFCVALYVWKAPGPGTEGWLKTWPASMGAWLEGQAADRSTLLGTLAVSMQGRSFYYTLAYSLAVVIFGIRRIRRRKTPYVTAQTVTLMLIQVIPLFLLPELILPWMGYNGAFDAGAGRSVADALFEPYGSVEDAAAGVFTHGSHPRAYWRAYGFILAWPLMVYNVFTDEPMVWWLVIAAMQTFVIIPGLIYFWGKGAYCGWLCSCGALAETLGDAHRHKMPHGPFWNRLNMAGQVILGAAFALLGLRIAGWVWPGGWADQAFEFALNGKNAEGRFVNPASYKWMVDVFLAGIVGVGFYFWFSGRVWCRFFCPLAALMHVFTRFSRFRILADKKKCISCNVCTSVCHQGIDVMSFANKGLPMEDPQCVRCSACVQSCPTGVLFFGQVDNDGSVIRTDGLGASPVRMAELVGDHSADESRSAAPSAVGGPRPGADPRQSPH